jgi:hypothetical protein
METFYCTNSINFEYILWFVCLCLLPYPTVTWTKTDVHEKYQISVCTSVCVCVPMNTVQRDILPALLHKP